MCSGTGVSQRIVGNFKADIFKNTYQRLLLKKLLLLLSLHKNGKEKTVARVNLCRHLDGYMMEWSDVKISLIKNRPT